MLWLWSKLGLRALCIGTVLLEEVGFASRLRSGTVGAADNQLVVIRRAEVDSAGFRPVV